ncbi:MAG: hypothetical protein PHU25_08460 [Deltaproteobacteria bacterium]|nr:hypothetical protein [Deltaproteobacteria bacterium]
MLDPSGARQVVRRLWREALVPGRCWLCVVKGRFATALILHYQMKLKPRSPEIRRKQQFERDCRKVLGRAGFSTVLIQPPQGAPYSYYNVSRYQMPELTRQAKIEADRMSRRQWGPQDEPGWKCLFGTQDRIEMWSTSVERRGDLYRVIEGAWDSSTGPSEYREKVAYVGGRRGAMLYAGYAG